jgi:hypothetical protein
MRGLGRSERLEDLRVSYDQKTRFWRACSMEKLLRILTMCNLFFITCIEQLEPSVTSKDPADLDYWPGRASHRQDHEIMAGLELH